MDAGNVLTIATSIGVLGGAFAFVAWPLAKPAIAEDPTTGREKRRAALEEEKERLLSAISDLEHDHATGKMEDGDYTTLTGRLKGEAAKVLREIDVNDGRRVLRPGEKPEPAAAPAERASEPAPPERTSEPAVAKSSPDAPPPRVEPPARATVETDKPTKPGVKPPLNSDADARPFCTKCGRQAKTAEDRFCGRCGAALPDDV